MHFESLMHDHPHAKRCEAKNDIDCELRTHVKLALEERVSADIRVHQKFAFQQNPQVFAQG